MTSDNLSSSLVRAGPVLSALVIAAFLFAWPLSTVVQQTAATTALTEEEQKVVDTQDSATENLSESDRDVNGIEFTPRWGAVSTIAPNREAVLFADCLEDEFAVSSMFIFESQDVIVWNSFPVAFAGDTMTWLAVVKNTDTNDARAASIGVICADENQGREDDVDIDINTKTTIQNTVNQFIQIQNNQITNLRNIVNIHQEITNNAIQIATVTGNNNTVSQVIQQSAEEILSTNTTNPANVQQIINQRAQQEGVISGGGSLSQGIDQGATQGANVTGGGGGDIVDQDIDQGATQGANATGGGNIVDQFLNQGAGQTANVTGGGGGDIVDQDIDQGATQGANVTGGGNATGGGSIVDQFLNQGAGQSAEVTDEE